MLRIREGGLPCLERTAPFYLVLASTFIASEEVPGSESPVVLLGSRERKQQSSRTESYWDSVTPADGFVCGAQRQRHELVNGSVSVQTQVMWTQCRGPQAL